GQSFAKLRNESGVDGFADSGIGFRGIDAIARQVEQDRRSNVREQDGEPIGLLQIKFYHFPLNAAASKRPPGGPRMAHHEMEPRPGLREESRHPAPNEPGG